MRKVLFILVVALFIFNSINAQDSEIEKYRNYDYFSHPYKYLDKDFNIRISHEKFQSLLVENNYYPERIKSYKDSIGVVLCGEFDNWSQVGIAKNRLAFTWLRAGYYLWLNENDAEKLGAKYGFEHPYKLYQYCYTDNDDKWDKDMKDFMNQLRVKVQLQTNNPNVWEMSTEKFLNYCLLQNPVRQRDFESIKKERSNLEKVVTSEVCGKQNCCQNQDSNKEPCDSLANSQ